jgi:hypothetical protein
MATLLNDPAHGTQRWQHPPAQRWFGGTSTAFLRLNKVLDCKNVDRPAV